MAAIPGRVRADFAYYRTPVVQAMREAGWDYSSSVTRDACKAPVLDRVEGLPESAWTDIGGGDQATWPFHRPGGL